MFIDDDDELYDSTSIERLLNLADLKNVISISGQTQYTNTKEINEPWTHHHGTLYNLKLLKIFNIHYDSRLLYEEDGAFARMVLFTPEEYQKLKLYEIVYKKNYNSNSLTCQHDHIYSGILYLLGLATLDLQYTINANLINELRHTYLNDSVVIKNLLYLLAIDDQIRLTKEQYTVLLSFIIQYNNITRNLNFDTPIQNEEYQPSLQFQNSHMNYNNYEYSIDPVINYDHYYLEWLMTIFLKIDD